jgi:DNA-binding beta-propeller fold protein YncE
MLMLRRVFVVMAGVLAVGLLGAGSAFGAFSYPFDGQLAPAGGAFGRLSADSVAVDDLSGETYVAESNNPGAVYVFDSSGAQLASLDGTLTPSGSFGVGGTAVAANNGTGEVYVLDEQDSVVDVFESAGGYVCQITGSSTPSASECNGAAGSATPAGSLNHPEGIAVDQATGEVYVLDQRNGVVDVFGVGGAYLRQASLAPLPYSGFYSTGVAVSGFNGHLYVAGYPRTVYEFDGSGAYVTAWEGANTPAGRFGGEVSVAVDDTSGEVYVTGAENKLTYVFGSAGEYIAQFGHSFSSPRGTAVDQASHRVYVANEESVVDILGPAVVVPDVTTGTAGEIGPNSATLHGSVNPDGIQLSDCHFEYGTDTSYGQSAPCVPAAGAIPADSSEHAVSATLAGLVAGTTYLFRLAASNANGPNTGADATFVTPPPPSVEGAAALNVTGSSVDLGARVNPNGYDTTYRFEWGVSTGYGHSVPVPDGDVGAGTSGEPVGVHVSGLSADTTYHWRVVARSANGTTTTGDHTFIYSQSGTGLPDNRAYEMVTPPRKNAALIGNGVFIVPPDVGENGSRMTGSSIQCFGGAVACTAYRGLQGDPYLFSRTSGGWVTTPLAPSAAGLFSGQPSNTPGLVSADAGTALFSVGTPPAGEDDWWARGSDGSFVDVGPLSLPVDGAQGPVAFYTVSTADLSHVAWTTFHTGGSGSYWPFDSTLGEASVYEYVGGDSSAPVLVGVSGGLGSTDLISDCGTYLGGGGGSGGERIGGMSADGRTVFFTATGCSSGSGVNAGVAVPADEVFARVDESRSVLISGRSPVDCTGVCQGSAARQARFVGAAADGSRVFFTSAQQLTNDASEGASTITRCSEVGGSGCNLYEYDFAGPGGRALVAASAGDSSGGGPRVQGVLGISADGSHAYFVAKGVLSAAANSQGVTAGDGAENLYVFERDARYPEGHVAFIGALSGSERQQWTEPIGTQVSVSPDGGVLVFTSRALLTADDTSASGAAQVFRYDAVSGVLTRISIGDRGFNDNGNRPGSTPCGPNFCSEDARIAHRDINVAGPIRLDPTMSHDGSFVFFESPVALAPGALDDVRVGTESESGVPTYAQNVYEYHHGRVYLISDGKDTGNVAGEEQAEESDVKLIGSDATGANVFFATSDRLVPQDTDTELDYYDARVCTAGDPCITVPSVPAGCLGEACHGTPPPAPSAAGVGSVTFAGPGNIPAPVAAAKKTVKKKHVKHKARKRPKHKRAKGHKARHEARGKRGGRS